MKKPSCPETGAPGRLVGRRTVASLVRAERRSLLEGRVWAYCTEPSCKVVYFADDGTTLTVEDVRVRVGSKVEEPPHPVCYCFGHTKESIREEMRRTGRSTVVESVTARVKAGECSCETSNPLGTCCLGDLRRTVREVSP